MILDLIDQEYAPYRHAAKRLARDAGGVSTRTAENWLRRVCAPRSGELLHLMRNNEALRSAIISATEPAE